MISLRSPRVWPAIFIFVSAFALYFFTRSPGLDEWDSVQFAMGINDFDLWRHRPHPPGYPLFIFLGWAGHTLFHWSPEFSLHVVSCLGGALFVSAWFLITRIQFNAVFAWIMASTLAITPIVWMTTTKVLSDSLAAGLLSVELLCGLGYLRSGKTRDLIFTAISGAAAAGARPQIIPVAIIILLIALWQRRPSWKTWLAGLGTLIFGCWLWLLPMSYLQWKLRPDLAWWQVYPALIYKQWQWRLDKPVAYIGAGGWNLSSLRQRFVDHIVAWFEIGFGFSQSTTARSIGIVLILAGLAAYFFRRERGAQFWRIHIWWAVLSVLLVFCFLPWDQRYYLSIFPLLLILFAAALFRLPQPWRWLVLGWPLLFLWISLPLAIANHSDEAPPVQMIRYLQMLHSPAERGNILLVLRWNGRHAQWYGADFAMRFDVASLSELNPILPKARVIYTDDRNLDVGLGRRLTLLKTFERSELISPKHDVVELYRVDVRDEINRSP